MPSSPPDETAIKYFLDFDGLVYWYEGGYAVSIKVMTAEKTPGQPDGVDYAFALHAPGRDDGRLGPRILGMDNAHSPDKDCPWDHYHPPTRPKGAGAASIPKAGKPTRLREPSILQAFDRFHLEVGRTLEELGVDPSPVSESTKQEVQQRIAAPKSGRAKGAKR